MRRFSIVLLMLAASSCLSEKIESASSSAPVPSSRVYTSAEERALRHMETFYSPSTRSSERVQDRLNHGMPVYTRGDGNSGGHAWVVDGYIVQRIIDLNGKYPPLKERTLAHINWGWGGHCDGYFEVGVFNATTPPLDLDPNVGDRGGMDIYNFIKRIKTLTWSNQ